MIKRLGELFLWIPAFAGMTIFSQVSASEYKIRHIEPYGTSYQIKESFIELPNEDYLEDSLFKVVQGAGEYLSQEPEVKTKDAYYIEDWEMVPNKSGWFRDQVVRVSDHNLDAENVFYYLHEARHYLEKRFGAHIRGLNHPKITVRVGMTCEYHMYLKFSDNPQYNNAATVRDPASGTLEIWFHTPKRIPRESLWSYSPIHKYLFKNSALLTAAPAFDGAKIAEVIFHEYGHVVTEPYLGVGFNTPVREGFADYLASLVSGNRILSNLKPFNPDWFLGPPQKYTHYIDGRISEEYSSDLEKNVGEGTQFVSSLFCELEDFLPPYLLDQTLINILEKLDSQSDIVDVGSAIVLSLYEIGFDFASLYLSSFFSEKPHFKELILERLERDGWGKLIPFIDRSAEVGSIIDTVENLSLEGVLEDQGKYIGRIGTHRLILRDGRILYLRRQPGNEGIDLYRYCGSDEIRRFIVSGELKVEKGLWSQKKGLVLEVNHIEERE